MLMIFVVLSDLLFFFIAFRLQTWNNVFICLCTGKQGTRFLSWNQKELSPFLTSEYFQHGKKNECRTVMKKWILWMQIAFILQPPVCETIATLWLVKEMKGGEFIFECFSAFLYWLNYSCDQSVRAGKSDCIRDVCFCFA